MVCMKFLPDVGIYNKAQNKKEIDITLKNLIFGNATSRNANFTKSYAKIICIEFDDIFHIKVLQQGGV